MQHLVAPLALSLLGASDAPSSPPQTSDPQPRATMLEWQPEDFLSGNKCRDSNLPTTDNPGHRPRLERGPATAGMGQYIYAVDRRIDGCSVVLVKGDGPAPTPPFGSIKLSPEQMAELSGKR